MIRVVVADDHPPFLRAARAVVGATPGFELVGAAGSGEEAIELAATARADLVLLDVHMPGIGGIEAARRITGAVCVLPVELPRGRAAGRGARLRRRLCAQGGLRPCGAAHAR